MSIVTKPAVVNGVLAPSLNDLKTRPCTLEELQASIVHLINLHNEQGRIMEKAINSKEPRKWENIRFDI